MQKIIFTDLDGTLTLKDTYTKFVFQNLNFVKVLKNLPILATMLVKHKLKIYNDDDVKQITFKMFFEGYDSEQSLGSFADEIPWNMKVRNLIDAKREEGYRVIIVTASPDVYVKQVCQYLGYDGFISTQTQESGRYLSGVFKGRVCNFDEKPKRIEAFMGDEKLGHTISYGNSSGDFAMLRFCDESYFVNKLNIKRFEN